MKIKAKQIVLTGAFIVLTIVGYKLLPRDEIVINLNSEDVNKDNFEEKNISGNVTNGDVIYVHIEGAVNSPGIKIVPKGTRVFEILEMADGELVDADLSKINLASILKDEQKIYVPYKIVVKEDNSGSNSNNQISNVDNKINSSKNQLNNIKSQTSTNFGNYELININIATLEELQKLTGIGPSMAKKILDYREENGYFSSTEEIKNISGIGEAKYNKIKDEITI